MSAIAEVGGERRGDVVVARVRGEIDASNAGWIGGQVRALLTNQSDSLVLDLADTSYVDSAGIALIFSLNEELRTHQQQLHLVVGEVSPIARMLGLAGVDSAIPTHGLLETALAEAGGPTPG